MSAEHLGIVGHQGRQDIDTPEGDTSIVAGWVRVGYMPGDRGLSVRTTPYCRMGLLKGSASGRRSE
ncbi:MAG: hypothetical protein J6X98_10655 [Bacteroidales bacterium]|nr:hypothetical protein [Bacteroidales bacterium]